MLIAIVATLLNNEILSFQWIIVGIAVGSIIGDNYRLNHSNDSHASKWLAFSTDSAAAPRSW